MARNKQDNKKGHIERPAGEKDEIYIVGTCLAMTEISKGQKVGASLKATGKEQPGIISEVTSTELAEGVIITANDGGQKEVEENDMTH